MTRRVNTRLEVVVAVGEGDVPSGETPSTQLFCLSIVCCRVLRCSKDEWVAEEQEQRRGI